MKRFNLFSFIFLISLGGLISVCVEAQLFTETFFIDKEFDFSGREKILASLFHISQEAYFYLEKDWFENLTSEEKGKIISSLKNLTQEFDQIIYPQLTSLFGSEWRPGIDNNERITILFHQLKENNMGYFNNGDEFPRLQNPKSNEREMIYLNANSLFSEKVKSFLAHEFVHLITFNQKDRIRNQSEEVWLNELRADYGITYLGYNDEYQDSILQHRVNIFLENSSDSLIEWKDQIKDYGVINLFGHYLVEHYGKEILVDSLFSKEVGLASLEYALEKNKINKKISEIFTDWLIALLLNNCSLGETYCYKNPYLQNLRIISSLIFVPSSQKTNLSLNYSLKPWSGQWYRIIGTKGDLRLEFKGVKDGFFRIAYVLCRNGSQDCQIDYLKLDSNQEGKIIIRNFSENYNTLTFIPLIFNKEEKFFDFSLLISIENFKEEEKEKLLKI